MTSGHLGEWIAAQIFNIELEPSAAAAGIDGRFRSGALQSRTVNIKWYLKREGALDTTELAAPDYYLVLTGPPSAAASLRGTTRPWCIQAVFLFNARQLRSEQTRRGVKQGVASSVIKQQWAAAEIYPTATNPQLTVTSQQAELLRLFAALRQSVSAEADRTSRSLRPSVGICPVDPTTSLVLQLSGSVCQPGDHLKRPATVAENDRRHHVRIKRGGSGVMTGIRKPKSREAFDLNMNDAETLVAIVKLLENKRANRMRAELRNRIGTALRIPKAKQAQLECLENPQVFITFLPGSAHLRANLTEENLHPLLRQAIVAGCAAVETYIADRTMELLGPALRAKEKPPRLLELTMTVQQYLKVQSYQRKNWGLRDLIEDQVLLKASTSPSSIGMLMSMVGMPKIWSSVDAKRGVGRGSSEAALEVITQRRNKIAHNGDRQGRGRAAITVNEVERDLSRLVEIVDAIDTTTRLDVQVKGGSEAGAGGGRLWRSPQGLSAGLAHVRAELDLPMTARSRRPALNGRTSSPFAQGSSTRPLPGKPEARHAAEPDVLLSAPVHDSADRGRRRGRCPLTRIAGNRVPPTLPWLNRRRTRRRLQLSIFGVCTRAHANGIQWQKRKRNCSLR
jgi:hypothetical protein